MSRSSSSRRWLKEHHGDPYVKKARAEGQRSRAVYKLEALDNKDRLLRSGQTVIDLGSAPGGWSEYAVSRVGNKGSVIACDLLPMAAIGNVTFIQGDFTEEAVYTEIVEALPDGKADLVISDMAPNMTGNKAIDIPRAMYLVELAFDLALKVLNHDGAFVAKVFHGEGFDELVRSVKSRFQTVALRKPDASRSRSRETYIVARKLRVDP